MSELLQQDPGSILRQSEASRLPHGTRASFPEIVGDSVDLEAVGCGLLVHRRGRSVPVDVRGFRVEKERAELDERHFVFIERHERRQELVFLTPSESIPVANACDFARPLAELGNHQNDGATFWRIRLPWLRGIGWWIHRGAGSNVFEQGCHKILVGGILEEGVIGFAGAGCFEVLDHRLNVGVEVVKKAAQQG